jgi:hypothetical protein
MFQITRSQLTLAADMEWPVRYRYSRSLWARAAKMPRQFIQ